MTGGEPQQFTKFSSSRIFDFDWSTDGKQLVVTRGDFRSDVVLLSHLREGSQEAELSFSHRCPSKWTLMRKSNDNFLCAFLRFSTQSPLAKALARLHAPYPATEMITEINVPRHTLAGFLAEVREDFRKNDTELIYGTVRLIERDDESFLPWAKQPYACTIFNLHVVHSPMGIQRSADAFRRLIDMAGRRGGSYYLTYHRHATRSQVESCYPQFAQFLHLKNNTIQMSVSRAISTDITERCSPTAFEMLGLT